MERDDRIALDRINAVMIADGFPALNFCDEKGPSKIADLVEEMSWRIAKAEKRVKTLERKIRDGAPKDRRAAEGDT